MKKATKRLLAITIVMMLLLAGCGGNSAPASNSGSSGSPASGSSASGSNDFVFAVGTEPTTFDVHFITDVNTARANVQIYETLVRNVGTSIEPWLAESWSVSDDELTWTFKLREGVTFHDGTPFNAEAVKYNIERLQNPDVGAPRASTVDMITRVEVVSEYEVALCTDEPYGPMLGQVSNYNMSMMSPTALEEYGTDIALHPCGTGALMIKEWVPGSSLVMTKYDGYWGEKSTIDTLTFKFVGEDSSRVMMLQSGDADVAPVAAAQIAQIENDPSVNVQVETGYRTIYLGMNCSRPPFDDVRVRQAVAYAIDKQTIIDHVLEGYAQYPSGIESTVIPYSAQDLDPYTYNVEKAKELLAEAGYADGLSIVFHTPEGRYPMDRMVAEVCQSMLAEVGITAELRVVEWGAYSAMTTEGKETQLFLLGKGSPSGDPDYTLDLCFGTGKGMNNTKYSDPQIDQWILEQRQTTDQAVREEILYKIQEKVNDDCPQAVLYYEKQTFGCAADVDGFVVFPNEMIDLRYLARQ